MKQQEILGTAVNLAHNIVAWLEPMRLKGTNLRELNMIMGVAFALAAEDLKLVYQGVARQEPISSRPQEEK